MIPKKVLIFPAGTEIAFEIYNALKFSKFVELYAVNSIPCHGEFIFKNYIKADIPFIKSPGAIDKLNEVLDRYSIDYLYPAHDDAIFILTRDAEKVHASVVTSPFNTVDICRSKNKTYEFFRDEYFIPKNYSIPEEIENYPVFAKPSVGQGSVGARKISNRCELESVLSDGREYTICEYLPGEEYTVDCFTDNNGKLRSCHPRVRSRIKMGIAVRSTLIPPDEDILIIAGRINSKLVFNGAWFFQIKKNSEGQYRLMEISPRIPGTMAVSRNCGVNYPLLTLFQMWGYDVDIIDNGFSITMDRAFINRYCTDVKFDKVFVDFDDTLYIGSDVNIPLISFIYQCRNKSIPVILLTKHRNDIYYSLKELKISEDLFKEIIVITDGDDKSRYIDGNAILIDDSFAERKSVFEKKGIPVYDLDMIESLLDWRM